MKICILTSGHNPLDNRIFYNEALSLRKIFDDIVIIAQYDKAYDEVNGIKIIGIPKRKNRGTAERLKALHNLYERAVEVHADIYHCHEPDSLYLGYKLKKKLKSKLLYDCHEYNPEAFSENFGFFLKKPVRFVVNKYERYICKSCDCIITVNEILESRFREINSNVVNLPCYPNISMTEYGNSLRKPNNPVYLGGISEDRGCRMIIKAINRCNEDIKVTFIGEADEKYLKSLGKLVDANSVEFTGEIEYKNVPGVLSEYHAGLVLLQPSNWRYINSRPVKLFEYMACGLAVIAADYSMIREIVHDERCGILVDPSDEADISRAVEYMFTNIEETKNMGERGRKAIIEKYNWECIENRLIDAYRSIDEGSKVKNITPKGTGRQFTVVLSHDVDNITDKNVYILLHRILKACKSLRRGRIREFAKQLKLTLKGLIGRKNPYWNFEKYMELEDSYGFKSSFYFINGKKGRYGARYRLNKVANIIKVLDKNGWEVGLHTNYFSYNDVERIKTEKAAIESLIGHEVFGCRNHYLRFEVPDTWWKQKEAGLKYDTTLGYSNTFYPFDIIKNKTIGILEVPMVIMDEAILGSLENTDTAWTEIERILDEAKKANSTVAINFHSEVLFQEEYPGWEDIYRKILEYIKIGEGRGVTARQVCSEIMDLSEKSREGADLL